MKCGNEKDNIPSSAHVIIDVTPHDRPQLMTTIDHGQCCGYQGQYYNVGDKIPLAHKCAWLECRSVWAVNATARCMTLFVPRMYKLADMTTAASLDLVTQYNGCHCCLVSNNFMIQDGQRYTTVFERIVRIIRIFE